MRIQTLSAMIKNNIINYKKTIDIRGYAKKANMMIHRIPLKDGTTATILANSKEMDCLIMSRGKCVASKGMTGKSDDIGIGITKVFDRIEKRKLARPDVDMCNSYLSALSNYMHRYKGLA